MQSRTYKAASVLTALCLTALALVTHIHARNKVSATLAPLFSAWDHAEVGSSCCMRDNVTGCSVREMRAVGGSGGSCDVLGVLHHPPHTVFSQRGGPLSNWRRQLRLRTKVTFECVSCRWWHR